MRACMDRLLDSNLAVALLLIALGASLAANVGLGLKLRQPPDDRGRPPKALSVGRQVPEIPVTDRHGRGQPLTLGGALPSVLYVQSEECVWCRRNLANIRVLAAASTGRYQFKGLSLSASREKVTAEETLLGFEVVGLERPTAQEFGLAATPTLIVVSADGRVEKIWGGALSGALQGEVEAYFGVRLPGLQREDGVEQEG